MVLHPQHKLMYVKNAGWKAEWIKTARELVQEEFDRSYSDFKDASLGNKGSDSGEDVRIMSPPPVPKAS
ncbi:hypothetical protein C0992_008635 [Termitomyces sp. T32_za158]|nr:hypothetical protein C0992_008635 [Termitomyces sp. T32_za158]